MKSLSHYWKAIIGFLSLVSVAIVGVLGNPDIAAVLPPSFSAWLAAAGAVVGGLLIFAKRNELLVEQVDHWLSENGYIKVDALSTGSGADPNDLP